MTRPIAASELRYPRQIPLAARDLITNGDLPTKN
jgi:hypothetical protein